MSQNSLANNIYRKIDMAFNSGLKKSDHDHIQVLQPNLDVDSVIKKITQSGLQEDGFYICDISDIVHKYKEWKMIMPRVEPHYAVKCNDSKIVLEILASLGTGFDCASKEEISRVLSVGVRSNRIIFAHPTKNVSHLKYAVEMGVDLMTFDNVNELYKIKTFCPDAKLVIRIKYDDLSARHVLGNKFGCDHKTEAVDLLRVASNLKLNIVGVSFHIGSGCNNYAIYAKAIAAARQVFDAAATVGYKLGLLDIGGGFPGEKHSSIKEVGVVINAALEKYFPDLSVKIIAEPGSYYVTSAFTLTSNIHSMKSIIETDPVTKIKSKIYWYYIDVTIYGALLNAILKESYPTKAVNSNENAELFPSIVWGGTCDSLDRISLDVDMLPEMSIGDWIIFENIGAYSLAISCEFNGIPTPKVHSIIDKESWLYLTEKVPFPMPKDKFVLGNKLENFRTGLVGPSKFKTNYF